jgi:uncharacterized protein (TIGR02001 family)
MKVAYLAAALALASAGAAAAQESPAQSPSPAAVEETGGTDISFNAALTSDYVYRGVSQTDEEPALQAGVDVAVGGVYYGAWASNVDFGDGTDAEVDFYFGIKPTAGVWAFDFGAIYYAYVGAPDDTEWNYLELKGAVSRPVGPATVGGAVFFSPAFTGETGTAVYTEVNASVPVLPAMSISGALGRQAIDKADDYTTWNLGAVYTVAERFSFDLRYWDTDLDIGIAEERVVLTAKVVG